MMQQDSSHPTGVAHQRDQAKSGTTVGRARTRKAQGAIALRAGHATWDEIATLQGYPSPAAAKKAVETQLAKEFTDLDKEQLRKMAGKRLDLLMRAVWAKAVDPDHPEQMVALTKSKELINQHADLFGYKAPSEMVVYSPTAREIEDWVAARIAQDSPQVQEYDILEANPQEDGSFAVSDASA